MKRITSPDNPVIKEIRKLHSKKGRQEAGLFFFEGIKLLEEAANSGVSIDKILVSDSFLEKHRLETYIPDFLLKDIERFNLPDTLFSKISESVTPQGVLAVARQMEYSVDEVLKTENPMLVYLQDLQDPGNLGTILRSADAAGASAVLLSPGSVELYNPKVIRGAMGSVFHFPILEEQSSTVLEMLKKKGIRLAATLLEESTISLYEADLAGPLCIIIGNESAGLPESVSHLADLKVKIPMAGKAESLNAGVAASVILFEALRQRGRYGQ